MTYVESLNKWENYHNNHCVWLKHTFQFQILIKYVTILSDSQGPVAKEGHNLYPDGRK
jgi:hypothetical protein